MPEYYIHEERTTSVRSDWLFRRELEKQDERGGMYGLQPASQPEPAGATRGFTRLWLWVCRRQAEGKGTTQIGISLDKARGADAKPRIT